MQFSFLSLLFAGVLLTFNPGLAKKQEHIFIRSFTVNPSIFNSEKKLQLPDQDTLYPANVGINTLFPVRPLHVVGSSLFENKQNDSSFASISFRKSYNGNYNIGEGRLVGALLFQDGMASIAGVSTAKETNGVSNAHLVFNTTNGSGIYGERFRITEEGILNYAADMSALYTERSVVDKAYVDAKTGSTLDGALALGNTTGRPIIFQHAVSGPLIRKLTPDNTDSVYEYDGNSYTAQYFTETIQRFDGVNGSGRPNYAWMFGYNQNGGGGRLNNNDASMHLSMETHYESGGPLMELHIPQVQSLTGITQRLLSFTVNKTTGSAFTYFTAGSMEFRSPATIAGGVSPHYASFSPAGIDLQNPDPSATTALRLYSNNGGGSLTIHSGTGQSIINTNGSTVDLTIQTPRFLNLSNQIQFNDAATAYNNGNVTFDLPSQDENKAFIFRNLGQHPLIEFRDNTQGNPLTTVYGNLKLTGKAGTGNRLLAADPEGLVNAIMEGNDGEVLKMVAGQPTWMHSVTGWDSIMEYSFKTSNTDPVDIIAIPIDDLEAINVVIDFIAIQSNGAAFTAKRSILASRNSAISIGIPQDIVTGNSISGNWEGIHFGLEETEDHTLAVRIQPANAANTSYKAVIKYRKVQVF